MLSQVKGSAYNTAAHGSHSNFDVNFLFLYCLTKHPHISTPI